MEIVDRLLAAGAEFNGYDRYGHAAIHGAAYSGKLEVMKRLVAAGADVNMLTGSAHPGETYYRARSGQTALYMATQEGHTEIVKFLVSKGAV